MTNAQQVQIDKVDDINAAPIIPAQLAIQAMRDSGYKNTAYALAELIDNSVQANATHVEIICVEQYKQLDQRSRKRMDAIAVLDNGGGMNAAILRQALQFGNGTRLSGILSRDLCEKQKPPLDARKWLKRPSNCITTSRNPKFAPKHSRPSYRPLVKCLDEIFGVTNNKQAATVFTELATLDYKELLEPDEDYLALIARLRDEGDPKGVLLDVSQKIKDNLDRIRGDLRDQGRGRRAKAAAEPRHDDGDPTEEANDRWKQRDATNPLPDADAQPTTADIEEIEEDLAEQGHDPEMASEIVARIVSGELKVIFVEKPLGGSGELFTVFPRGTMTEVVFNRRHPAFGMIFDTVSSSADDDLSRLSTPEMQDRLVKATRAMKLLFIAWARMEREDAPNRETLN